MASENSLECHEVTGLLQNLPISEKADNDCPEVPIRKQVFVWLSKQITDENKRSC